MAFVIPPQITELFKDKKKRIYIIAGALVIVAIVVYLIFFSGSTPAPETTTTTTAGKTTTTKVPAASTQNKDEKAISEAERLLKKLNKDFSAVREDQMNFLLPNQELPIVVSDTEFYVQAPFDYLVRPVTDESGQIVGEEALQPTVETSTEAFVEVITNPSEEAATEQTAPVEVPVEEGVTTGQ
jgi:hypothetical protein